MLVSVFLQKPCYCPIHEGWWNGYVYEAFKLKNNDLQCSHEFQFWNELNATEGGRL